MLQLDHISKTFRTSEGTSVHACDNLSLDVDPGEFLGIQGSSGCGKTTMLLIAGGLLKPDQGTVMVDGQDPYELAPDMRARFRATKIGFVFQQFYLVSYLSVAENIMAASIGTAKTNARRRADELMKEFGLTDRAQQLPGKLSTGERQRTALARALFNEPKLLLADEPTGNLDSENSAIVLQHMQAYAEAGGTVVMVSHDPSALDAAHSVKRLVSGKWSELAESEVLES